MTPEAESGATERSCAHPTVPAFNLMHGAWHAWLRLPVHMPHATAVCLCSAWAILCECAAWAHPTAACTVSCVSGLDTVKGPDQMDTLNTLVHPYTLHPYITTTTLHEISPLLLRSSAVLRHGLIVESKAGKKVYDHHDSQG